VKTKIIHNLLRIDIAKLASKYKNHLTTGPGNEVFEMD